MQEAVGILALPFFFSQLIIQVFLERLQFSELNFFGQMYLQHKYKWTSLAPTQKLFANLAEVFRELKFLSSLSSKKYFLIK